MKHRLQTYRDAYLAAIEGKSDREKRAITKRFLALLVSARNFSRIHLIEKSIRREYLRQLNRHDVVVESAAPLPEDHKRSLRRIFGVRACVSESVNQELLAGIRITVDDEIRIDATGKGILDQMFSRSN